MSIDSIVTSFNNAVETLLVKACVANLNWLIIEYIIIEYMNVFVHTNGIIKS